MATRMAYRLPVRAIPTLCTPSIASKTYLQPQWRSRIPKTTPKRTWSRGFAATANLKEKKYTSDHEWVEIAEDGKTGTVGITEYAAKALGDVVFVELPELELEVKAGDSFGAVESVKSASDINSPVSGKVIEVNDVLGDKPGTINKGPEAEGWIAKIEVQDQGEMGSLMGKEAYDEFTAE